MGKRRKNIVSDGLVTAILVDGGFFRKQLHKIEGVETPEEAADFLNMYCKRHLNERIHGIIQNHSLYRIFYYDCPPIKKSIYNPVTKTNDDLGKSETFFWVDSFMKHLNKKRKFALRLGKISDTMAGYNLKSEPLKKLLNGKLNPEDITMRDVSLSIEQKGVDMKIGLDIASMAYKNQVDQIVLISGDSDFVSAAKLARREGIDFILDPLGQTIKEDLQEHIDGLRTVDNRFLTIYKK